MQNPFSADQIPSTESCPAKVFSEAVTMVVDLGLGDSAACAFFGCSCELYKWT